MDTDDGEPFSFEDARLAIGMLAAAAAAHLAVFTTGVAIGIFLGGLT